MPQMARGKYQWRVEEGRGRWRDFPSPLNEMVEEAFLEHGPTSVLQYTWPSSTNETFTDYAIDFAVMKQINLVSNYERTIRRTLIASSAVFDATADEP